MRTFKFNFCIIMSCLIVLSLTLTASDTFGQKSSSTQSRDYQKKNETLTKIKTILKETNYHIKSVKAIYKIAKKATLNFDIYLHIADLAHEFGYHTEPLVKIAKYASDAKVETTYFNQLADLVVMKLSETQQMVDIALTVSKLDIPTSEEVEKNIQEIKKTTDFKTMDEAKAYNKTLIDKIRQSAK